MGDRDNPSSQFQYEIIRRKLPGRTKKNDVPKIIVVTARLLGGENETIS